MRHMATTVKSFSSGRILGAISIVLAFILGVIVGIRWIEPKAQTTNSSQIKTAAPTMAIPAGQSVVGFLDMVDGKPTLSGQDGRELHMSGWAACADSKSPLSKVDLLVDQRTMATVTPAYPRPDVAAAYGRSDFEKSGWKSSISVRGVDVGEHKLTAIVTCANGEIGSLPPFRLVVTSP